MFGMGLQQRPAMVIGDVLPLMGALVTVVGMPSSPAVSTLRVDWEQNFMGLMTMQAELEITGFCLKSSSLPTIRDTMAYVSRRVVSKLNPSMMCF